MSGTNRKNKLSMLLIASLITANFVCASDAYKNNVVDVKVNKESGNAVKVTIYTDKPYTEPVVVNKKANNKYVILMPETKSSLKSAPTVTNGSGTISNVTVNTQDVSGGKGYTKIIITSEKTINVVPKTQQLSTSSKSTATATKPTTTKVASNPVKTTTPPTQQTKKTVTNKPKVTQTTTQTKTTKPTVKPTVKPVAKTASQSKPEVKVQTPSQSAKQPIEILEQEIKTGQYAQINSDTHNDEVLNKEIKQNFETLTEEKLQENNKKQKIVEVNTTNKSVIENIKAVIKDYQNISLWKLLLLAGAITFPIIVILLILNLDKKINKRIDKSFKKEEEETVSYEPTETTVPDAPEQKLYSSFGEMLNEINPSDTAPQETVPVSEPELNINPIPTENIEEATEDIPSEETQFENDYVDTDFEHDFDNTVQEPIEEIPPVPTPKTDEEVIEDVAEEENDLPAIVNEAPVEVEPYNPDGYLSDFANINDSEFFDELTLQTMADNNADGLPEESPADEIFNFMNDNQPISNEVANQTESIPEKEPEQQTGSGDELTMLTEVKLNDKTGLYLVNYENFSSLVGHIDENYFVVKKFDEIVNAKIIMKETERLKDATRYLVRVGKNKMVVEVSDTSMSRLLDL